MPDDSAAGFDSELGLTFLEVTPDGGRAQLTINDKLLQPWGIVHGGVYCSIVESLASVSAHVWLAENGGGTVVGVNNNTDFLRAIASGTVTRPPDAGAPRPTPAAVADHHHRRQGPPGRPRPGPPAELERRAAAGIGSPRRCRRRCRGRIASYAPDAA